MEPKAGAPSAPLFAYSDATIEPRWQYADYGTNQDEPRLDRSLESAQVQRYLHYPVSADQAEIRAGLEGAADAPAEEQEPAGL
jgi:hypothetical protein